MLYKNDIYFDKNYGKLYEKIEYGKAGIFKYEDEYGVIVFSDTSDGKMVAVNTVFSCTEITASSLSISIDSALT